MKAIVTGGAGFIGSHLVDRLLADGWDVTVIDDLSGPVRHRTRGVRLIPSRAQEALVALPVDAVFHLAGKVGPTGVLRWAGKIVADTVDSTAAAAQWALASGCPMVEISTSEVYGSPDGLNTELTPRIFAPGSSARMEYAIGKLAAETMLLNTPGLDVRIVRPFNVAGPRQSAEGGFVVPRFVAQALTGQPLTVYAPGTQTRALTHVSDVVEGILATYARGLAGEAYNIGWEDNASTILELAQAVREFTGTSAPIDLVDPRTLHGPDFRDAADKIPDSTKARTELGWEPQHDLTAIIRDVVAEQIARRAA